VSLFNITWRHGVGTLSEESRWHRIRASGVFATLEGYVFYFEGERHGNLVHMLYPKTKNHGWHQKKIKFFIDPEETDIVTYRKQRIFLMVFYHKGHLPTGFKLLKIPCTPLNPLHKEYEYFEEIQVVIRCRYQRILPKDYEDEILVLIHRNGDIILPFFSFKYIRRRKTKRTFTFMKFHKLIH
jgi:hypothetical protein